MDSNLDSQKKEEFDILNMDNYRTEKLPTRNKKGFEKWLATIGPFVAIAVFLLFAFVIKLPFLEHINPESLTEEARKVYQKVGSVQFTRLNAMMIAIFLAGLVLWISEGIPNYLTSLIIIISLVLTGVLSEKTAYAQLGHPVMWLNIMSFVLASMLVKTGVAKRFALWFILRFGKNASSIFLSFIVINVLLSAFISATTAKAAILLPIFMVIAAIYGSGRTSTDRNNFGRSIVLQNLFYINMGASGFMTGSGANLLAVSLIAGAIGSRIFFSDWLMAMFPVMLVIMFVGYIVAMKIFFPLKKDEKLPQIEGGMDRLKEEYLKLGEIKKDEIKSVVLFLCILILWATDKYHGISPTAVAFSGAIIALLPKIGILKWNEVDIPWHLMLFSAGAYTLGAGLEATDLPQLSVNAFFSHIGIGNETPFWVVYLIITGVMMFSAMIFESKTMRAMIFIPLALGIANRFGFSPISLALPVAFLIEHVYVLPFNSKPAALLYETGHYSISDSFKYGITMMLLCWVINIIAAETWFRFLGITPNGVFNLF
ncbi:SLC13 family permease [Kaistella jeonii]|uniref:Sodium:sulfate symporter n=1 Tax=Kaistella jeonii TaxID=266749 RepID=A0A0C1CZK4_9FLAO|nr:DASS family sodium-coupled anion symporter [Kaistella jeonii]KIA89861.1 sodium:sulfate symporter [Kaistella jeonii]SFB84698.1 anion transporter [Kaistella jeonii]VEI96099.1 Na(+)/dicarboxylate symporter [Kaistella jeonii]